MTGFTLFSDQSHLHRDIGDILEHWFVSSVDTLIFTINFCSKGADNIYPIIFTLKNIRSFQISVAEHSIFPIDNCLPSNDHVVNFSHSALHRRPNWVVPQELGSAAVERSAKGRTAAPRRSWTLDAVRPSHMGHWQIGAQPARAA